MNVVTPSVCHDSPLRVSLTLYSVCALGSIHHAGLVAGLLVSMKKENQQ